MKNRACSSGFIAGITFALIVSSQAFSQTSATERSCIGAYQSKVLREENHGVLGEVIASLVGGIFSGPVDGGMTPVSIQDVGGAYSGAVELVAQARVESGPRFEKFSRKILGKNSRPEQRARLAEFVVNGYDEGHFCPREERGHEVFTLRDIESYAQSFFQQNETAETAKSSNVADSSRKVCEADRTPAVISIRGSGGGH